MNEPSIICLCGSTRFYKQFQEANYHWTMKGYVVLVPGFYSHSHAMVKNRDEPPPLYAVSVGLDSRGKRPQAYARGPSQYIEYHNGDSSEEVRRKAVDACWESYEALLSELMPHGESVGVTPEQKKQLDELHKRKIDMSDAIFVINVGGYIGESTFDEIVYAAMNGREVELLEPEHAVELWARVGKELFEKRDWSKDMLWETIPTQYKAQVKARLSWLDWTDEDIEQEIEAVKQIEEQIKELREVARKKDNGIHNE